MGLRNPNRVQPELCDPIALLDVDVPRFPSLKAVKEEAKARNPEDSWHWVSSATSIRLRRTRINAPDLSLPDFGEGGRAERGRVGNGIAMIHEGSKNPTLPSLKSGREKKGATAAPMRSCRTAGIAS